MAYLTVDGGHTLYYELIGSPEGANIVFLHGGPGFGFRDQDKEFFSVEKHHVLLFEQRGAGRSTPRGELKENTTDHLIADIVRLMDHAGMASATMFGGSWGSSLALLMAIRHPDRVDRIVMRGFFPATRSCVHAMLSPEVRHTYPTESNRFTEGGLTEENFVRHYFDLLNSGSEVQKQAAAMTWSSHCALLGQIEMPPDAQVEVNHCLLTTWYAMHDFFLPADYITANAHLVKCEAYLVHGAWDMLCPLKYALELQARIPQLALEVVDAGHSSLDHEIFERLKAFVDTNI